MIRGVSPDKLRGLSQKSAGRAQDPLGSLGAKPGSSGDGEFAAKLFEGASSNERIEKPGREPRVLNAGREGDRSAERETAPQESKPERMAARPQQAEPKRKSVAPQRASDGSRLEEPALQQAGQQSPPQAQPQQMPQQMPRAMNAPEARPRMDMESALQGAEMSQQAEGVVSAQSANSPYADTIRQPQGQPVSSTAAAVPGQNPAAMEIAGAGASQASEATLDLLAQMREEQGLVRRKAMEDFMVGMKQELGIPPERILEAFSKMSETALQAPPEASMKEFLGNLQIEPEQAPRAAELYKKMVFTTGEAALNEKLIGLETGVNYEVLTPKQEALRKLNSALDDMNNMFAMRGPHAQVGQTTKNQMAAESMEAQIAQLAQQSGQPQPKDEKRRGMGGAMIGAAGLGAGAAAALASQGRDSVSASSFAEPMVMQDMSGDIPLEAGQSDAFAQQLSTDASMSAASAPSMSSAPSMPSIPAAMTSPSESSSSSAKGGSRRVSTASADAALAKGGEDASAAGLSAQSAPVSQAPGPGKAMGPAAMIMSGPQPTPEDEQANIRELIQQAQVVLKKGGGEMKMELKPEGIGQLHLKVSVENGQVNVQMLTENDAAKRTLERGFSELKAHLAAHQLHVDNMKVEVGSEIQKHMDQNQDLARQQARQFASDFMGQFRDDRQGFRQGFMDRPGWSSYNKEQKRSPADPAPVARAQSARKGDGSKRLDLVA